MSHYVCTGGCDGESTKPGVCEMEGCDKEGKPLIECTCDDSLHGEAYDKANESTEEEPA